MAIFDITGLEISNGDTSDEADINDLLSRLVTSFNTTVENRLTAVEDNLPTASLWAIEDVGTLIVDNSSGSTLQGYSSFAWAQEAKQWASNAQGTVVTGADNVATTKYSAKALAQEAKAWAQGTGGVDTEADGTTVIPRSAKEYAADTAGDAASTAADVVTTNADVVTTNANVLDAQVAQAAAEAAEANAGVSEYNAGVSAVNAIAAENKAELWADQDEDVEVETGKYSAKHWAAKAEATVPVSVPQTSATGSAEIPTGTTAERDATPSAGYFRFNSDEGSFEGYDGTEWGDIGGGGLDWSSDVQSTDFTAEPGFGYFVDTSAGAVTITLPVGEAGARVAIRDYNGTFLNYPCILTTTDKVEGTDDDLLLDRVNSYVEVTYTDATQGWKLTASSPLTGDGGVDYSGRKNYIIDGNFNFWDEGAGSFTSDGYTATMWFSQSSGSNSHSVTRESFTTGQSDVPNNPTYFHRTVVTAGSGVADYSKLQHYVEGMSLLSNKTVTLSFWAKADSAKEVSVELQQNFGTGGSSAVTAIGSTKLSLTTSWARYTVTINIPSILGKTIGIDPSLVIRFWFSAGSDYDSQTDSLGNQSGTFDIAQVQLEKGSDATDFEYRTYSDERFLISRYYLVYTLSMINYVGAANGFMSTTINYPIPMRTIPTASITWSYTTNSKSGNIGVANNKGCMIYAQAIAIGNAQATANPIILDARF